MKVISIAPACSSFAVGFALYHHENFQFVAFYDPSHRLTVGSRSLDSDQWTFFQPEGRWLPVRNRPAHIVGYDSHNYLTLTTDAEGYLHLSGNMHGDLLIYFRSTRPLDVTSLVAVEKMIGTEENSITYPLFFRDTQGRLIFRYRNGQSGNGADYYNVYDTATKTWSRLLEGALLHGEGKRNAYSHLPQWGPDGFWHIAWVWREHWLVETNHSLSYARSRNLLDWEKADGTPIPRPIVLATGDVVDPAPIKEGLINMTYELGLDHHHRAVLTYHRYDAQGKSQIYAARFENGAWCIRQLSQWNFRWDFQGAGSIPREVTVSPVRKTCSGELEVAYDTWEIGAGVWRIDEATLRVIDTCPPSPPPWPVEWSQLRQGLHPEMKVQSVTATAAPNGKKYVLRWEALPINRDEAHKIEPPPTALELLEL
jgi:hypothetical protein